MKLSHRKKLAHKRYGVAKGWAKVVHCRQLARKAMALALASIASDYAIMLHCTHQCNLSAPVVYEEKQKQSLLSRFVNLVSVPFRRLLAAGTAQADILRGRLG